MKNITVDNSTTQKELYEGMTRENHLNLLVSIYKDVMEYKKSNPNGIFYRNRIEDFEIELKEFPLYNITLNEIVINL